MNWSKYNYLFKSDKFGYLLYNSLSNGFVEVDEKIYLYLKSIEGKQNITIDNKELQKSLLEMKVIVDNDLDEFYNIKYSTQSRRFSDSYLGLTINPTLHCNFACTYCFENNRRPVYMTDYVENGLIDFVKKIKKLNSINVTWFGGEPLMAFDRMLSITKRIKELNIPYRASMITNGYLLSNKVIDNLDDLSISHIQITIDGLAEIHNKRRLLISGEGTFGRIIKNIDNLKMKKPDYPINIRVNIDNTNADNFIDVLRFFINRYEKKINVAPGFVTDTGNPAICCLFDNEKIVEFVTNLYKKYNANVFGFFPPDSRYECPIRNPNHLTIGPQGEIYKCWLDVGNNEMVVGSLIDKNVVNNALLTRYYVAGDALEDANCKECFHFPICGGGCPHTRIENELNGKSNLENCDFKKGHLKEFLELHYDYKQKISKK
jgi:uncharacterized protein